LITLIVPTFNRAYALKQVLDTFYTQVGVSEILFIDDASTDETGDVVNLFAEKYPNIKTIYLRNETNKGASYGRKVGFEKATNEYIMYCDDDEFLGPKYASVCLEKLNSSGADVVSGRHFYRDPGESFSDSIKRFGDGLLSEETFDKLRFQIRTDAIHQSDIEVPFTHAIFITKKELLQKYSFDTFYSKGNGFREESDFQMNLFCNGGKILVTNDVHCVHMHLSEVKSGGQRVNRLKRFYWTIYYTNYFLDKYFNSCKSKLGINYSKSIAKILYLFITTYTFFIRPFFILPQRMFKS